MNNTSPTRHHNTAAAVSPARPVRPDRGWLRRFARAAEGFAGTPDHNLINQSVYTAARENPQDGHFARLLRDGVEGEEGAAEQLREWLGERGYSTDIRYPPPGPDRAERMAGYLQAVGRRMGVRGRQGPEGRHPGGAARAAGRSGAEAYFLRYPKER